MGGERVNIAKVAGKVANKILPYIGWEQVGGLDQNWKCCTGAHGKRTHSTDVCWYYNDPYTFNEIFLNTDLKSMAAQSLPGENRLCKMLRTVAESAHCAGVSDEWAQKFEGSASLSEGDRKILGCLFMFNHDEEGSIDKYDLTLSEMGARTSLETAQNTYFLHPRQIQQMTEITNDLDEYMRDHDVSKGDVSPYYGHRRLSKLHGAKIWKKSLRVEDFGNLILPFMLGKIAGGYKHLVLYYRGPCESEDEFLFLIDYLLSEQHTQRAEKVVIKVKRKTAPDTMAKFESSKRKYGRMYSSNASEKLAEDLEMIKLRRISQRPTVFDVDDIAMEK